MFNGESRQRKVAPKGRSVAQDRDTLIRSAAAEREARALEKRRNEAAVAVQAAFRGLRARQAWAREHTAALDAKVGDLRKVAAVLAKVRKPLLPPVAVQTELAAAAAFPVAARAPHRADDVVAHATRLSSLLEVALLPGLEHPARSAGTSLAALATSKPAAFAAIAVRIAVDGLNTLLRLADTVSEASASASVPSVTVAAAAGAAAADGAPVVAAARAALQSLAHRSASWIDAVTDPSTWVAVASPAVVVSGAAADAASAVAAGDGAATGGHPVAPTTLASCIAQSIVSSPAAAALSVLMTLAELGAAGAGGGGSAATAAGAHATPSGAAAAVVSVAAPLLPLKLANTLLLTHFRALGVFAAAADSTCAAGPATAAAATLATPYGAQEAPKAATLATPYGAQEAPKAVSPAVTASSGTTSPSAAAASTARLLPDATFARRARPATAAAAAGSASAVAGAGAAVESSDGASSRAGRTASTSGAHATPFSSADVDSGAPLRRAVDSFALVALASPHLLASAPSTLAPSADAAAAGAACDLRVSASLAAMCRSDAAAAGCCTWDSVLRVVDARMSSSALGASSAPPVGARGDLTALARSPIWSAQLLGNVLDVASVGVDHARAPNLTRAITALLRNVPAAVFSPRLARGFLRQASTPSGAAAAAASASHAVSLHAATFADDGTSDIAGRDASYSDTELDDFDDDDEGGAGRADGAVAARAERNVDAALAVARRRELTALSSAGGSSIAASGGIVPLDAFLQGSATSSASSSGVGRTGSVASTTGPYGSPSFGAVVASPTPVASAWSSSGAASAASSSSAAARARATSSANRGFLVKNAASGPGLCRLIEAAAAVGAALLQPPAASVVADAVAARPAAAATHGCGSVLLRVARFVGSGALQCIAAAAATGATASTADPAAATGDLLSLAHMTHLLHQATQLFDDQSQARTDSGVVVTPVAALAPRVLRAFIDAAACAPAGVTPAPTADAVASPAAGASASVAPAPLAALWSALQSSSALVRGLRGIGSTGAAPAGDGSGWTGGASSAASPAYLATTATGSLNAYATAVAQPLDTGALTLFYTALAAALEEADDLDFFEGGRPLSLADARAVLRFTRVLLFRLCWADATVIEQPLTKRDGRVLRLMSSAIAVFDLLFARHGRRPLCDATEWLWPALPASELTADVILGIADDPVEDEALTSAGATASQAAEIASAGVSSVMAAEAAAATAAATAAAAGRKGLRQARAQLVLSSMPQVVPFDQRVALFAALRERDHAAHAAVEHNEHGFLVPARVRFTIRRARLVQDAYDAFRAIAAEGKSFKAHFQIQFFNKEGLEEAGIDGGGLLKEFIDSVVREAFSPAYGLFAQTTHDKKLYPNPDAAAVGGQLSFYTFLGRLLGKALYEGILVEPRFTSFFLRKLLGRSNLVDDLASLDPEYYRSLIGLKRLPGDVVEDLGLTFEVTEGGAGGAAAAATAAATGGSGTAATSATAATAAGIVRHVPLKPGGASLPVTSSSLREYIHLVTHHRLNARIGPQVQAFLRGFRELLPLPWIRMFGPQELQTLLGGSDRPIDLRDLRANTNYSNGFYDSHPYIQAFWRVLDTFTEEDKRAFLMFTTSCSHAPLLGFGALQPKFGIAAVPISHDSDRLPTASTCFALLKLPHAYSSEAVLRDKLLFAIHSASGFELT